MTHLSKKKLEADTEKLLSRLTASVFNSLTGNELNTLKDIVISPTEFEMIKKRLGIILFLERSLSQDEIARITKTTRQTVARIYLLWKTTPQSNKSFILKRLNSAYTKDQLKKLLSAIIHSDISRSAQLRKIKNQL